MPSPTGFVVKNGSNTRGEEPVAARSVREVFVSRWLLEEANEAFDGIGVGQERRDRHAKIGAHVPDANRILQRDVEATQLAVPHDSALDVAEQRGLQSFVDRLESVVSRCLDISFVPVRSAKESVTGHVVREEDLAFTIVRDDG